MTLTEHLTSVADAIREKTGETAVIPATEFAERILAIEAGSSGGSELIAAKTTASFPSGLGSRSVSATFSKLSSITYVIAYGIAGMSYSLFSATKLGLSDDASITVNRNTVTVTASPGTNSGFTITIVAIGEPA